MPSVARVNDSIQGMTTADHHFHYEQNCYWVNEYDNEGNVIGQSYVCDPPHIVYDPPVPITGTISSGSNNVFINGQKAAFRGSSTNESDAYDTGAGSVSGGSDSVFVNGMPIARIGDGVTTHNGTGTVTGGSSTVFAG